MRALPGRHEVAERARWVRRAAVRIVLALLALDALVMILGLSDLPVLPQIWLVGCVWAISVGCFAEVVHLVVLVPESLRQPRDSELPRLGWWARVATRGLATVALGLVLCGIALTFLHLLFESGDGPGTDTGTVSGLDIVMMGASFTSLLAVVTGVAWGVSEVVAGYREPRGRAVG